MGETEMGRVVEILHEIDAPPRKVWRALSVPELRERWLPAGALADPEATHVDPGREIAFGMRDAAPPHLGSTVTFSIEPGESGGTRLRIVHALTDARVAPRRPANDDAAPSLAA